jgi:hypothetical protein
MLCRRPNCPVVAGESAATGTHGFMQNMTYCPPATTRCGRWMTRYMPEMEWNAQEHVRYIPALEWISREHGRCIPALEWISREHSRYIPALE